MQRSMNNDRTQKILLWFHLNWHFHWTYLVRVIISFIFVTLTNEAIDEKQSQQQRHPEKKN